MTRPVMLKMLLCLLSSPFDLTPQNAFRPLTFTVSAKATSACSLAGCSLILSGYLEVAVHEVHRQP